MVKSDDSQDASVEDAEALVKFTEEELTAILKRLWALRTTKEPFCSISAEECTTVAYQVSDVFAAEETLLEIPVPVTVCGDTHGL